MSNELQHWGIKGMRWGVRRYQNKDGSLTDAGKKRYDRDIAENNAKKKDNRINIEGPDPNRWVKEDMHRTKDVTDGTTNMVRELKNLDSNLSRKPKRQTLDLSNMTDQEMRSQINRAMLERQYQDMFAPQKVSKGREYARKTLEVAGTVLTIGSTALGIAIAIKDLKG